MFGSACAQLRTRIYGVAAGTLVGNQLRYTLATGFMIAPGVVATAGHSVHLESNPANPAHQQFGLIRTPDVGQPLEPATLIAFDTERDVALLRVTSPRSIVCVELEPAVVPIGISCGSLGFPLATATETPTGTLLYTFIERFQSASVSAYRPEIHPSGLSLPHYETDSFMYPGSSGCAGFLVSGKVFGLHVRSLPEPGSNNRLGISVWVPAATILEVAERNGVTPGEPAFSAAAIQ